MIRKALGAFLLLLVVSAMFSGLVAENGWIGALVVMGVATAGAVITIAGVILLVG